MRDLVQGVVERVRNADGFEDAANSLCSWAQSLTGCEAVLFRLWCDGEDKPGWIPALVCRGLDARFLQDETLLGEGECVCGRVCRGRPLPDLPLFTPQGAFVCDSAQALLGNPLLTELGARGRCLTQGFESIAIFPLGGAENPIGCLHLTDKRPGRFADHAQVLAGACAACGPLLASYDPADREHLLLGAIERALTPDLAGLSGLEAAVCLASATQSALVGGDFYDIVETNDGGSTIFVGDVAGKGLAVAGEAARLRQSISLLASRISDPSELLSCVNESAARLGRQGRFATLAVCRHEPDAPLKVATAGHPPPLVLRGPREAMELGLPPNPPLGVFADASFAGGSFSPNRDDVLLLYTDGVSDSRRGGRFFGAEGIASPWPGRDAGSLEEFIRSICRESTHFHDPLLPPDDRLALAVRFQEG